MNLKHYLQSISPETTIAAVNAHSQKIDSLDERDLGVSEIDDQESTYPGLAIIAPSLVEALKKSGLDDYEAVLIAIGASITVNALIEIAEVENLPNIES